MENKMVCPVTSAGFRSGAFSRFLGKETHFLIHTECSAQPHWLCRSDPETVKYILLSKAAFQCLVWPGQAILFIYTWGHLYKILVSLPQ